MPRPVSRQVRRARESKILTVPCEWDLCHGRRRPRAGADRRLPVRARARKPAIGRARDGVRKVREPRSDASAGRPIRNAVATNTKVPATAGPSGRHSHTVSRKRSTVVVAGTSDIAWGENSRQKPLTPDFPLREIHDNLEGHAGAARFITGRRALACTFHSAKPEIPLQMPFRRSFSPTIA
jgi:hypothetical protein